MKSDLSHIFGWKYRFMWLKQCHFYHPWLGMVIIPPIISWWCLGDGANGIVLTTLDHHSRFRRSSVFPLWQPFLRVSHIFERHVSGPGPFLRLRLLRLSQNDRLRRWRNPTGHGPGGPDGPDGPGLSDQGGGGGWALGHGWTNMVI